MITQSKSAITSTQIKQQLSDSGNALANLTAHMVYEEPAILKALLEVTWEDVEPWSQRASKIVSICGCRFPEMIGPYVNIFIGKLNELRSEGARRNFLKIFAQAEIRLNRRNQSILLNLCFDYLTGAYSIAVKVYSMDVIYRLGESHPEIRRELYYIIDDQIADGSAGVKSHGSKILDKIRRETGPAYSWSK